MIVVAIKGDLAAHTLSTSGWIGGGGGVNEGVKNDAGTHTEP